MRLGAASATRVSQDGSEVLASGPGGGLAASLARLGVEPAADALSEGERLTLQDGPLTVSVERRRWEALLRVAWAGGQVYEDLVRVGRRALQGPELVSALHDPSRPLRLVGGRFEDAPEDLEADIPAVAPGALGSASFRARHGLRAACVAGPLGYGVSGPTLVSALGRADLLGFLGTTGLDLETIREAMATLTASAPGSPAGVALPLYSDDRRLQEGVLAQARLLGLRTVLAWATAPPSAELVRFRAQGLARGPGGRVQSRHRLFVQVSNPDAAAAWMRPAPSALLDALVARGQLTPEEASLARRVPVAGDLIAAGHVGGRTERWPLLALLPCLLRERDRVAAAEGYAEAGAWPHLGAAGELGDPASVHAAFGLGADFVVTGTVNECSVEAATSNRAKQMLAEAGVADSRAAPSADRFEVGGRVVVLARGTRFAQQAEHLYHLYRRYRSLDEIPETERRQAERVIFGRSLADLEAELLSDLRARRPVEADLAEEDPRHRMALVFRWYLDQSARWAIAGTPGRARDYQVWSGPAVGLFNDWVRGTWLQPLVARRVVTIATALLLGAAVMSRVAMARARGFSLPPGASHPAPQPLS